MKSPIDKLIVSIPKKYQDEIVYGSLRLYFDPSYQPEWYATIKGVVTGTPIKLSKDPLILPGDIQPGDEVLFSYLVVFDRDFYKDSDKFSDNWDGNPFVREFRDGEKRTIRVTRLPDMMVAMLLDPRGELLDGCSGDYKTVERWLTGFKFQDSSDIYHYNMFMTEDKELWTVPLQWCFAKKVKNEWEMLNGYALLEPIETTAAYEGMLEIPEYLKKGVDKTKARLVSIGQPLKDQPSLDVKPGDIVYIDYPRCEKYEIDGKNYFITTQKKLLAKHG